MLGWNVDIDWLLNYDWSSNWLKLKIELISGWWSVKKDGEMLKDNGYW